MSFGFAQAPWLWALPAAAAPVVMHLAWRMRRRRLEVPSLAFFTAREPRLHARKRLRDLLVLALRCLVIAAAVCALARPSWQGWGSSPTALAIVIDNSASMALPADLPGAPSRLQAGLADAGALIAALGAADRAVVITTVADPLVPALDEATTDRARLRAVLDSVRPTAGASSPGEALARAAQLLAASASAQRALVIISDGQAHDWGAAPIAAQGLPLGTRVILARVPAARGGCLALARLDIPGRGVLGARPLALAATIANDGAAPATVLVAAEDDGGRRASASVAVGAHAEAAVPLVLPPAPAGDHWARVWIDGASVPALAEGYLAYTCAPPCQVAFYGAAADFALLPLAISPDGEGALSGLQARLHDPAELAGGPPTGAALAVLTWQGAQALGGSARAALEGWMRQGGRVLLLPSAAAEPASAQPPDWALAQAQPLALAGAGAPLIALDPRADCFRDLVDAQGAVRFPSVRLRRGLAIGGAGWHGLLGLEDGRAVLSARAIGAGELALCGFAFAPRWSSLPLSPACLPLAQAFALADADAGNDRAGAVAAIAGSRVRVRARPGSRVAVVTIAGAAEDWQGQVAEDGTVPGFPRAGVYLLRAAGAAAAADAAARTRISVRADRGEAAEALCADAIPALASVSADAVAARSPAAVASAWAARRGGQDLMPALVLCALLALFAEGILANRPLMRARPAGAAA